jgi:hypothetical protein
LAVLNDHIRPSINIQNRRNKHTFDTYAFTIDIFPHVLEIQYFVGLIHEIHGNMIKKAQLGKHKANLAQRNQAKAHPITKYGSSTTKGATQAQPGVHPSKVVASGASPGVATPGVRRTPTIASRAHLALAVAW